MKKNSLLFTFIIIFVYGGLSQSVNIKNNNGTVNNYYQGKDRQNRGALKNASKVEDGKRKWDQALKQIFITSEDIYAIHQVIETADFEKFKRDSDYQNQQLQSLSTKIGNALDDNLYLNEKIVMKMAIDSFRIFLDAIRLHYTSDPKEYICTAQRLHDAKSWFTGFIGCDFGTQKVRYKGYSDTLKIIQREDCQHMTCQYYFSCH